MTNPGVWASGPPEQLSSPRSELVQSLADRHGASLERSLDLRAFDPFGSHPLMEEAPGWFIKLVN